MTPRCLIEPLRYNHWSPMYYFWTQLWIPRKLQLMVSGLNHRTNIRADRASKKSKCTTVIKIGAVLLKRESIHFSIQWSKFNSPWLLTMHNLDFFKLFSEESKGSRFYYLSPEQKGPQLLYTSLATWLHHRGTEPRLHMSINGSINVSVNANEEQCQKKRLTSKAPVIEGWRRKENT